MDELLGLSAQLENRKPATFDLPDELIEELSPEERKKRQQLLKDPRIREQFMQIYNAIDAEYEHILTDNTSISQEITDWAHSLLAETRYILMNYQVEHLARAEWNVEQVRARLDRAEESARQGQLWSKWIALWSIVWFFIFVFFIFNPDSLLTLLQSQGAISNLLVPDIFLRSLFFGGIGGVTAAFYYLLKYITRREFDPEFNVSYFGKPFMGMIIATLVYMIVFVVMRLLRIIPGSLDVSGSEAANLTYFMALSWVLSLAAGFKENVAFELLDKVMSFVLGKPKKKEEKEEVTPPPGPFD
ncbi:MAG: hypothetical protein D6796_07700 [Caldilineae bacterium]|nr:MAG: hypothetical protein D6796_07700 [Caldilineae bacterium]